MRLLDYEDWFIDQYIFRDDPPLYVLYDRLVHDVIEASEDPIDVLDELMRATRKRPAWLHNGF